MPAATLNDETIIGVVWLRGSLLRTRTAQAVASLATFLEPGGYLVVVDQRRGTLTDWVPREDRGKKHYWIAETTVVREAREQGFTFVEAAESLWHVPASFVLIFQRPRELAEPGRDPDPLPLIPESVLKQLAPAPGRAWKHIAFVALGEGGKLMPPVLTAAACPAVDIVLEEWATRKDERPSLPAGLELPAVLTEKGSLPSDPVPLDAVFFLDSYHLLFHTPTLLTQLHERLTSAGRFYVIDRQAARELSHREASHRRMIALAMVKQEMTTAGFSAVDEESLSASGRFLAVFEKAAAQSGDRGK